MQINSRSKESVNLSSIFFMFNKNNRFLTFVTILIFLLFGFGYLYIKTPSYKTYTSIELDISNPQTRSANSDDILSTINSPTINDIETQIDLLKSKHIISTIIDKLDLNVRYYISSRIKTEELYPNSLFEVLPQSIKSTSVSFVLEPVGSNRFKLYYKKPFIYKLVSLVPVKSVREKMKDFIGEYSYDELIKTPYCSFKVMKKNHLSHESYEFTIFQKDTLVDYYKSRLHITPSSLRSSLIEIELQESNPYILRDFLNTLSEVYIEQNIKKRTHSASVSLNFINEQLKSIKRKLQGSAEQLKHFKKRSNIINVDTKSRELVEKLIQADEQAARLNVDLSGFLILKKELDRGNFSALIGIGSKYPALSTIIRDLQSASAKRSQLLTTYTPKHPEVIAVNERIENLKKAIKNIAEGIEKNLKNRKKSLDLIIKRYNASLNKLPGKEQMLANYERKYNVNEKLYSYLLERKSELSLAKASKVSDARVIDKATVAAYPYSPKRSLVILISVLLGLITSIILILIKNRLERRIKTAEDIRGLSFYPTYGIIPYIKDRNIYNKVYVLEDDNIEAKEAFRRVRADIEFMKTKDKSKIILVTSLIPKEGKTVIAANLAVTLGSGEKKTLLVSMDFRKPEIHNKFNITNEKGISDLFLKKAQFKEIVWQTEGMENFHIITAGNVPKNPFDLIDSKYMKLFLEKMRRYYDYIIVETSPVDIAPDALVLSKYADITIFTIKSEFSSKEDILKLNEIIEKYKIKNPGFILHSVKNKYMEIKNYDKRYVFYQA